MRQSLKSCAIYTTLIVVVTVILVFQNSMEKANQKAAENELKKSRAINGEQIDNSKTQLNEIEINLDGFPTETAVSGTIEHSRNIEDAKNFKRKRPIKPHSDEKSSDDDQHRKLESPQIKAKPNFEILNNPDAVKIVDDMLAKSFMVPKFPKGTFPAGLLPPPTIYKTHNILFCGIPKNSNSQFRALLCRTLGNRTLRGVASDPYHTHYMQLCIQNETLIPNHPDSQIAHSLWASTVRKFAVVRDPIERFVSGVIDKCLRIKKPCFQCYKKYFSYEVSLAQSLLRTTVASDKDDDDDDDFSDDDDDSYDGDSVNALETDALSCFTRKNKFTIKNQWLRTSAPTDTDHSVNHFFPQFWFCDFQSRLSEYTLLYHNKSEAFKEASRKLMLNWEVPNSLINTGWGRQLNQSFLSVSTRHSTAKEDTSRYRSFILSNLTLLNSIFTEYYVDYYYFAFPLPSEAIQLCRDAGAEVWKEYEVCGAIQVKKWPTYAVPNQ